MRVDVNRQALRELERNPDVKAALDSLGGQIADVARPGAPRSSDGSHGRPPGFAASTIHHELGQDERGPRVRVSWSKEAFYLMFHELGTSKKSARPFLRPALARRYNP